MASAAAAEAFEAAVPHLPHFRLNKQTARALLQNFSRGGDGSVYEKHWEPAEADHTVKLVERATLTRTLPPAEKATLLAAKAAGAAGVRPAAAHAAVLEIPLEVRAEKQVRAGALWRATMCALERRSSRVRAARGAVAAGVRAAAAGGAPGAATYTPRPRASPARTRGPRASVGGCMVNHDPCTRTRVSVVGRARAVAARRALALASPRSPTPSPVASLTSSSRCCACSRS
jgi:hypothetical protein